MSGLYCGWTCGLGHFTRVVQMGTTMEYKYTKSAMKRHQLVLTSSLTRQQLVFDTMKFMLVLILSAVALVVSGEVVQDGDKKASKRGVLGVGWNSAGWASPASPFSTAASYAAANSLGSYNLYAAAPSYNPWALGDPASAPWAGASAAPWAGASAAPWAGAGGWYKHLTPAQQAANDVASALTAAKEATAAAALAQQRVAVAKETLLAQQRIAAAKESAAAAAIQRSEAAAAAAAAIQRSEAAHAAAAAIQRSAASAAHASAASAAAAAAAATPVPSHASGHGQWLAAKKAAEYAAWG